MRPEIRQRLEGRLGLLGINWTKMAKIVKINPSTLSRYLSIHYATVPDWLLAHILHALHLEKAQIEAEGAQFNPACLLVPHPHFGTVCSDPGELSEAARWFRETYTGPPKK